MQNYRVFDFFHTFLVLSLFQSIWIQNENESFFMNELNIFMYIQRFILLHHFGFPYISFIITDINWNSLFY